VGRVAFFIFVLSVALSTAASLCSQGANIILEYTLIVETCVLVYMLSVLTGSQLVRTSLLMDQL
jgi:hypothetical protein